MKRELIQKFWWSCWYFWIVFRHWR